MARRPRHPKKDLEEALRDAEDHGWTFEKGQQYYKGKCPCGSHMKTVRLSPSGARYKENLMHWFGRLDCWKDWEAKR